MIRRGREGRSQAPEASRLVRLFKWQAPQAQSINQKRALGPERFQVPVGRAGAWIPAQESPRRQDSLSEFAQRNTVGTRGALEGVLPHACPGTATQRTSSWGLTAGNSCSPFPRPKSERGCQLRGLREPPCCSPFRKFQGCEESAPGTGIKAKDYFYDKSQYHNIEIHRSLCSNVFPEKPTCPWDGSWWVGGGGRADAPAGSCMCKCLWSPAMGEPGQEEATASCSATEEQGWLFPRPILPQTVQSVSKAHLS